MKPLIWRVRHWLIAWLTERELQDPETWDFAKAEHRPDRPSPAPAVSWSDNATWHGMPQNQTA